MGRKVDLSPKDSLRAIYCLPYHYLLWDISRFVMRAWCRGARGCYRVVEFLFLFDEGSMLKVFERLAPNAFPNLVD